MNLWALKPISLTLFILLLFIAIPVHTQAESVIAGYPDYSEIEERLEDMNHTYPALCSLNSIGRTYEGRTIWALKISDNPEIEEEDEPDVLIMGAHHAKELISAMVPLMFAESLLENYSTDPEIRQEVDSTEIWIIPVVNPDGYQYAVDGHLDWRKNRRPIDADGDGIVDGIGVDLNRNYAHHWGEQGTSMDPNSDIYCGPSAFSENETLAIRNLVLSHHFVLSVSFHSYGQVIYHPWGNSIDPEPMDTELMDAIGAGMAGYNLYRVMEGNEAYVTTGDSDDWLYANTTCLPFTVEVGKEFVPPPQDIEPIFLRNRGALIYLISVAHNPYLALSTEKTNLRVSYFEIDGNVAEITVENQGNYSVSAELQVRSSRGGNSTRILLRPHEKSNITLGISDPSLPYRVDIYSLHGAEEWNWTDNSAIAYPPVENEEDGMPSGIMLALAVLIVASALLMVLFKKHEFH